MKYFSYLLLVASVSSRAVTLGPVVNQLDVKERLKAQNSVFSLKEVLSGVQALTSIKKSTDPVVSAVQLSPEVQVVAKKYAQKVVMRSANALNSSATPGQPIVGQSFFFKHKHRENDDHDEDDHEDDGKSHDKEDCVDLEDDDDEEEEVPTTWFGRKKKKMAAKKSAMMTGLLVKVFTALKKSGLVNVIVQMSLADEQSREGVAKMTVLMIERSDTMLLRLFAAMKKTGLAKSTIRFMMLDPEVRVGIAALVAEMNPLMIELGDLSVEDFDKWGICKGKHDDDEDEDEEKHCEERNENGELVECLVDDGSHLFGVVTPAAIKVDEATPASAIVEATPTVIV